MYDPHVDFKNVRLKSCLDIVERDESTNRKLKLFFWRDTRNDQIIFEEISLKLRMEI